MTITSDPPALWRAGLTDFTANLRAWLPTALVFFVFIAALGGEVHYLSLPVKQRIAELKKENLPIPPLSALIPGVLIAISPIYILILSLQRYIFLTFFLRRKPALPIRPPTNFSLPRFLRFILFNVLYGFVVAVPMVAGAVITANASSLQYGRDFAWVGIALGFVFFILLAVRLYLMVPLSVTGARHPIRQGWALTEGNFWRIFGNTLIILLIMMIVYLPFILIGIISGYIIGIIFHESPATLRTVLTFIVNGVFSGAFAVYTAGLTSAYESAVLSVLIEKKRSSHPEFVLVT